ncbi:hypothetical protein [Clostridium sp. AWRP]|uniref:hypothetical protein n=1 Tax=Clostridium sp. AWRP TaxID=2212991 RepID=UPI0015861D6D|nr:hypothetical protein [Clostridium sp. AWRP]
MNSINILIAIGGVVVLGATLLLFPNLKKKGIDVDGVIDKVANEAEAIISVGKEVLLPANPVINVLDLIDKWAKIAAGNSQQLSHAGVISKDARSQVAENVVLNVCQEAKIPVDENKKALIDAAIKNAVNDFGHEPTTEAQKQEQIIKLTQENADLKQKLEAIQNTVASTQNTSTITPVQNINTDEGNL